MYYVVRQSLAYIHREEMMGFIDLCVKDEMSSSLQFEMLKLIIKKANYQTATRRWECVRVCGVFLSDSMSYILEITIKIS